MKRTQRLTNFFATSLQRKLLLVVSVVVTLVMIAFGFYLIETQRQTTSTELEGRATRTANLLAQTTALPLWNIDPVSIEAQFKALMADPEVSSVNVYETSKSQPTVTSAQETAAVDPITRTAEIILQRGAEKNSLGTVQIVYSRELLYRSLSQTQVLIGLIILTLIVLLVIIIYFVTGRLVTHPLHEITALTSRVSAGDYTGRANLTSRDEIGMLAATFNSMTNQLQGIVGLLEQRVAARTAQLQASAEVGRAAISVLEREQLLREVVNLITERFGFYYAAIFTLDVAGRYAVLREGTGEAGRILKERGHQLEVGGQSMVGFVTAQRRARIALDVGEEAVRFANPLLPGTRSEIALPLIVGNRVLGALDVQSTHEAAFDEANATVLQSMADQIAIALNNAEQFKQTERQAKLQASLNHLNRSLFAAGSAADLYRVLATELNRIVPHDYLSLTLAQSAGAALHEYVLHAEADSVATEVPLYSPKNSLSGRAFTTRQPAFSRSLAEDANLDDVAQLMQLGFHSALSLPLIVGERVLGTLNFASKNPEAFSLENSAQFEQLSAQVAGALETQRLAQAQQNSLREMEALTRQLTGQAWAKRLSRKEEHVQYARSGLQTERPAQLPEMETAIQQLAPVAWSRSDDPDNPSPYTATLVTPILLRGEVLGALQVSEANRAREWNQDDMTFIQAVADQVALALDNARLLEETERRAQRERLVAEVSSRMFASNDLESIIQIAGQELGRVLRVDRAEIKIGTAFNEPASLPQSLPEIHERS